MRIVHNTTFHVNKAIEDTWMTTLLREYIPCVKRIASCSQTLFTRIKFAGDEGASFSLQLFFDREEEYRYFVEKQLEAGLSTLSLHFPGEFLYFCTTLE